MKSKIFVAGIAMLFALAAIAGCASEKKNVQPPASEQPPSQDAAPPVDYSGTPPVSGANAPPDWIITPPVQAQPVIATPAEANDPPAATVKAAFEKMKLGNAPTFGPIYRDYILALYARDYDKAYGLLSADAIEQVRAKCQGAVASTNSMLVLLQSVGRGDPSVIEELTRLYETLQLKPPRSFFRFVYQEGEKNDGKNPAEQYLAGFLPFTQEVIAGDLGYIKTESNDPAAQPPFVKEDGAWKMNFVPITDKQVKSVTLDPIMNPPDK
jgi:hypothetical protein